MLKILLLVLPIGLLVWLNQRWPPSTHGNRIRRFLVIGFLHGSALWALFIRSEWRVGGPEAIGWAILFCALVGTLVSFVYLVVSLVTTSRN